MVCLRKFDPWRIMDSQPTKMIKRLVVIFATIAFAFLILFISVLRSASVRYSFSDVYADNTKEEIQREKEDLGNIKIDYYFAHPGSVLPDHVLWPVKALRDKIWLFVTTDPAKKAELNLLFADKRIGSAKILFEKDNPELGFTTLTKSQKYFEKACRIEQAIRETGLNTDELTRRLTLAALKHRQTIKQIELLAPEDAKPKINEVENYTKTAYKEKAALLRSEGKPIPKNPFNGE